MKFRDFRNSLIFKISLAIVLAQILVMALIGTYYSNRFVSQVDNRIIAQIQAPAQLMNSGALSFEAISNRDTIRQIVGSDIIDALIVGADDVVYYSANADDVGKRTDEITRLNASLLSETRGKTKFGHDSQDNYVSISPVISAAGQAPFLTVYIKADGAETRQEKRMLMYLFVLGSLLATLLTSGLTILFFRHTVSRGLKKLTAASLDLGEGNLSEEVLAELPRTTDEIGNLAHAFRNMAVEIGKSREELQGYNKRLEKDVAARTAELGEKVSELERMNKLMIGRELKMIELKDSLQAMESKLKGAEPSKN